MPPAQERAQVEGLGTLAAEDVLALVLGGGVAGETARQAARRVLDAVPPWRLPWCRPRQLQAAGLNRRQAMQLAAALELGQRALRTPPPPRARVGNPADVAALCAPGMAALPRERVLALLCDRRQRLLSQVLVAEGWTEGCPVDPREVFRPALAERASGVILVHNHPSGDPSPSGPDRELTLRLARAGDVLGVKLVDHVVVATGGFASVAAQGGMPC